MYIIPRDVKKLGTGNVSLMLVEVDEMNVACETSLYTKVGWRRVI